ncbi:MAG: hypothetical protein JSU87_09515 [Gemmatimonadota bacterium]|nr:MAG: hypothetical protein JSU87_09515 [Gemmatimonadota bacterium]
MSNRGDEGAKKGSRAEVAASLSSLVEQEARRFLSEEQLQGDPARLADGWERRFIADAQRAEEAMELYSQLGYEVVADPVQGELVGEDCEDCQLLAALRFKIIYTRKRPDDSR